MTSGMLKRFSHRKGPSMSKRVEKRALTDFIV